MLPLCSQGTNWVSGCIQNVISGCIQNKISQGVFRMDLDLLAESQIIGGRVYSARVFSGSHGCIV